MTKLPKHWWSMHFKLLFLCFSSIALLANPQDVEILAKSVDKNGTVVHAKDDVVLYSDKYIITADEAFYDYNSSDVELFGNITMMQGSDFSTRSGYAKMNLNQDKGEFTPMFGFAPSSKVWMKCAQANFDAESYLTHNAIVSSCNVQDPDWKISYSSGKYSKQSKFIHLYNPVFYAADIPFFYLPYFAFSTDKTRRTGLLRPEVGYGSDEGFYYKQPFYYASQKNWDFQLDPQIRTSRGLGVHGTLRFVDSIHSKGEITIGQFEEQNSYFVENDLKNKRHWGYSIAYERSQLFSHLFGIDVKDGLLLDFQHLNDIDYLNTLDNDDASHDKLVKSTLNYFIKGDNDYLGLYAKYFIDTSKIDNGTTLQDLPTIQYHRFTEPIFLDNIYYNVDYQGTNYTRDDGVTAVAHELNIPITFHTSIFDDFLHFKVSENFYFLRAYYDNAVLSDDTASYVKTYHRLSLYTELAKAYDDFFHTFYLGAEYTIPSDHDRKGYFSDFITTNDEEENLALSLVEYFYDKSGKKRVFHSMKQALFFSDYKYKYGDLVNELRFYFSNEITLTNLLSYSHQYSRINKFQTSFNWSLNEYDFSFIHTYEKDGEEAKTNYMTASASTDYVQNYNFFANMRYDIQNDYFKSWNVGMKLRKKCWDYRLTYREERRPKLTSSGSDSWNRRGFYLLFNFYPIGGVDYDFVRESKVSGG